MPRVTFIDERIDKRGARGRSVAIDVVDGLRVLDAAVLAGALVATQCGGVMACLACRVDIADASTVSKCGEKESALLASVGAAPSVRLACQARVHLDTTVHVLPTSEDDAFSLD